jgi:hypothetical protein
VAISQHGISVLFTSHAQDGLVVNFYTPHNRRTPLQAEEALGPISILRGSRGVEGGREAYIIYFLTIFIKVTRNFKEISENVK